MKNMMKMVVAALVVALGLNTWAGNARLTVYATPSEGGTAKASLLNTGKDQWNAAGNSAVTVTGGKNTEMTIYAKAFPADGYVFKYWAATADGASVSTDNPYAGKYRTPNNYNSFDVKDYTLYAVFALAEQPVDLSTDVSVELTVDGADASVLKYDGTERTVAVAVKYSGNALTQGTDYTVSGTTTASGSAYEDKTYTVTITGNGTKYLNSTTKQWTIKAPSGSFDDTALSTTASGCALQDATTVAVTDGTKLAYVAENTWELSAVLKWPVTLPNYSIKQDDTDVKYIDEAHTIVEAAKGTTAFQTVNKQYTLGSTVYGDHTYIDTMTWTVRVTLDEVKAAADKGDTEMTFTLKAGAKAWTHSADGLKMTTYKMVLPLAGLQLNDNDSNIIYPTPHKHVWSQGELTDGKIVWTCQTTEPVCTLAAPYVTFDAASKVYNGESVAFTTTKSDNFATLLPSVTVGEVKYYKADGETEIAAPKYTGSYVAKVVVGEKTVSVPFAITKPTDGYTDGWEVNDTATSVRYDKWEEAIEAAADGDTIYYRDGDMNASGAIVNSFEIDFSSDKDITLDLGGAELTNTKSSSAGATDVALVVKNTGAGTVTLANGTIVQPNNSVYSQQVAIQGRFVFGEGIKTVNKGENNSTFGDHRLHIYSDGATLAVTAGQYNNFFESKNDGTITVSGGRFWSAFSPSGFLAENHQIRTIEGNYLYEVFGHAHSFKYVVSGNVITLVCEGEDADDCPYTLQPQKLILTAADAKFTDSAYVGAWYIASNDFVVSGATLGTIKYFDGETELAEAPTAVGGYVAKFSVTFGGETFTAAQAFSIGHDHLWEYTAEDDTITMSCTNTCPTALAYAAVLKVTDKTYTGAKQTPATVEKGDGFAGEVEISYSADPIAVGSYTAYARIGDATASKTFEIKAANIGGISAELTATGFDYTGADIVNALKNAALGEYGLTSDDYDISGLTTAKGSGYSNETYKVTLAGKGNFTGSKTLEWTIKAPTREFAADAFKTTSRLVFNQEKQAWETTSTLAWPYSTLQFTALEKALFTVDSETFFGNAAKNGITVSEKDTTVDQKHEIIKAATWALECTPAELDEAEGEDVVHTMTACGLVWADKFGLIDYGDAEGIKATDFKVAIPTKDLVLQLPANATYDLGATVLANVKIELGAGAKVTSTEKQANIVTAQVGNYIKETFENSIYTYENALKPITITVTPLEHADVTVTVCGNVIQPSGENTYTVSYGDTVVVTYTANENGYKPETQTVTLENVTAAQTATAPKALTYHHAHLFKFEANGATLTASCTNEETTCELAERQVMITFDVPDIIPPDQITYGTSVSATCENAETFTDVTGATIGEITFLDEKGVKIDTPKNVGSYKARVVVAPVGLDAIVLERKFKIIAKEVSGVTVTLDKASVPETGSEITAQIVSVSDGTTVYTVDDYDVSGDLTGKARGEYDVTLTFKGNYSGKAYASWEIVEGLASFSESGAEITAGGDYGEVEGNVLTITDSTKLVYDAQKEKWFASLTLTWPRTVKYFEDNKWELMPIGAKYTDVAHAWVKIGETVYTGTQITNGVVEGLTLTTATDKYYPPTKTKDVYDLVHPKSYTFVTSVTWTVEISTNELEKALEEINPPKMPKVALLGAAKATATPTLDKNGFLNYKATFGAYAWGNETEGDVDGLEDTKFTIRLKPEETTLFDEKGLQVWPHHDHVWKYALAGNVLTAACEIAGCAYEKIPLTVSIGPKTVAEKYCDQIPLEAKTDGDELFAEATGATVGSIVYDPALSAQPGTYTASAEVVSADGAVTNTIKTVLSILAGQGITNGVHVADLATYLEAKSQDSMTILVGKDFTASKQYVVPANWKAETAQEIGLTIQEFVTALFAGEYNDVITWDDVKDLIAGRTTAQELFQRVQDLGKKVTLLDCGTKTLDLNGFTVTAKEGEPLLRNEGTLVLTGEGTLVTNGCETLIVNLGTLSIESGTYVGSITNDGALVISGGYFTGAIVNGQGAVVLTGGTYEIKPGEDFIPAGYDLVKRDGLYTVEKHEHKYTFLPLGNSLMSATCWRLFVDDPDQLIQFSNCGAHKLGVFIATKDAKTGILPKKAYAYTGKPVEANIVGYNYTALAKIGVLKNIKELVEIAEDAMTAEDNWDEMNAIEKAQTMIDLVLSINDIDLDLTDLVWSQAKVEEETGLRFGAIRYYDATTDEELAGAPVEAGRYRASIVITTPKGNTVTRSWGFTIGLEYEDDFDAWLDAAKDELNAGWKQFKADVKKAYDRRPTEEEIQNYFDKLDENHRQYFENLTNECADVDQRIIDAHWKMVDDLKQAHEEVKTWTSNAVEAIKRSYEKHEDTYLDEAHEALKKAWYDFCDDFEREWNRCPRKDEIEDFFDEVDQRLTAWVDAHEAAGETIDPKIRAAHEKMVAELKVVHTAIVTWVDETFGTLAEEAEDESAPLLTMTAAPMAEVIEEEELSGWEKFKQDVKDALGRLPTEEEVEAFFKAEGIRHAQFVEDLKAKGVAFDDELKAAHEKMVAELKAAYAKIVARAKEAAQELEELYEKHEDTYFDEAHEALKKAWYDFCDDFEREWNRCPRKDEIEDFLDEVDKRITAWVDAHEAAGQEIDPKIIAAHEKMVAELKAAHEQMAAWLKGRFEQVSESELKVLPEEDSEEAPVMLTLSVAQDEMDYDGTGMDFELKGKEDFERVSECRIEGPYFRPFGEPESVTDLAPTAPGHYEVFYWIFKDGVKLSFFVRHAYYIRQLISENVHVYFENGTNFVYNGEEQGPKIWGVYFGLDKLVEGADYDILEGGTMSATAIGEYAFTVKGHGIYECYEQLFNWSIVKPTRTFEEGAFQIRAELEYNACTRTWDTVATLDWPCDLRQILRVPRYYTEDAAQAETTENFVNATVEPVLRKFYRIKTARFEEYVKAHVWKMPFTPEELTKAWDAGYKAITNVLTASAIASASEPAGMAETNFEYVVNLEGLKLFDDKGRQCYPIHNHDWTIENDEDGALIANCNCKGCPVGRVELSIDAESKDWDQYPVRATLVDEGRQFEIQTYAEIGEIVHTDEAGEVLRCWPTEPGRYRACAKVVIDGNCYKVWKNYEIRACDISEAIVHTTPQRKEFVYSGHEYMMRVDCVCANGRLLDEGDDYAVGGTLVEKKIGDYQIEITGNGHYTGTCMVDWSIVAPTREFGEEAFDQVTFDVPGPLCRKPYGEIEGNVLTVTASTNLYYDVESKNWYAGITIDWPYDLEQLVHAPQYTEPEKGFVKLSTATNVWSVLDILNGDEEAKEQNLVAEAGTFFRIRHLQDETYVKRIGWDVEITLADVLAAEKAGKKDLTYTITVGAVASADDPEGLALTTYKVVLPFENLVLKDEKDNQVYPTKHEEPAMIAIVSGLEAGATITWKGVDYVKGVTAFESFSAAFESNSAYVQNATNVLAFGLQTLAKTPVFARPWTLECVNSETTPGEVKKAVVTISANAQGALQDLGEMLEHLTGEGTILLSVTNGTPGAADYKAALEAKIVAGENVVVIYANSSNSKDDDGDIEIIVTDEDTPDEEEESVIVGGDENDEGSILLKVDESATNDVSVAGTLETKNEYDVIIINETDNVLAVGGVRAGNNVLITNVTESGEIVVYNNVIAQNDVMIDNNGHLEANVEAGGDIVIDNRSVHTLVGTYKAKGSIILNGDTGALKDVTLDAGTTLTLTGTNVITGSATMKAGTEVNNAGHTVISVAGDNRGCLNTFNLLATNGVANAIPTFEIEVDGTQAKDTTFTYILAKDASEADGMTFDLTIGSSKMTITEGTSVAIGTRTIMLKLVNDELKLTMTVPADPTPPGPTPTPEPVVTNVYVVVFDVAELCEAPDPQLVAEGECAFKPEDPVAEGWIFGGWFTEEACTNAFDFATPILADTVLYAAWTQADSIFTFQTNSFELTEGESTTVLVTGGAADHSTAVTLNLVKGTYTSVSATMLVDGKAKNVRFPLTLNWTKGETEPKAVTIVTKKVSRQEADKFFTLQLSAPVGGVMGVYEVSTVTVCDSVQPAPAADPYVRALAWPANDGKVSGAGKLPKATSKRTLTATAKKWATFAGWYKACTNDATRIDTNALVTTERKLKVTQAEAGTYFAWFKNGTPVIRVEDPDFSAEGTIGVTVDEEGTAMCQVGWYVEFALDYVADADSKPKLSVSKLPSGLKYDKKTGLVYGIPKKAGAFTVTVKGKNVSGKHTITFKIVVLPLPEKLIGTFEGALVDASTNLVGTAKVKLTKQGKATAQLKYGKKSYSFSGNGFVDGEDYDMLLEKKNVGAIGLVIGRDDEGDPDGTYKGIVEGQAFGNQQLFFEVE